MKRRRFHGGGGLSFGCESSLFQGEMGAFFPFFSLDGIVKIYSEEGRYGEFGCRGESDCGEMAKGYK
jgi:hypothetical protein